MLREDALAIWKSGVDAVDSKRLVSDFVRLQSDQLVFGDQRIPLEAGSRIEIVGGGKAGAGMVAGLREALADLPESVSCGGWVNVPADCAHDSKVVTLHPARPAGINEPFPEGVEGTREILRRVSSLTDRDLCITLISGGGSALLPAPADGISLDDKIAVTRQLASAGTTIQELNLVRSQLSTIKGGGLLKHCRAGRMVALIISDVVGDPLEKIASGPTVPSNETPEAALEILRRFDPDSRLPPSVYRCLERSRPAATAETMPCSNYLIGSNCVALSAARAEAQRLGYHVIDLGSENVGEASEHGRELLRQLQEQRQRETGRSVCILAGGETTVQLAETSESRKGGRNQEVVLAAIADQPTAAAWDRIALLSGGTDGEDGPTDAAGALADQHLVQRVCDRGISPDHFLRINNSYPFFNEVDGLIRTGPTHTNVMDLAVGLVQAD